jgi:hypothetical protein
MRRISKWFLALQALALAYPSFLGLLLVLGGIVPLASGSIRSGDLIDAAIALAILVSLIAAWYVMLVFLIRGHVAARVVPKAVWFGLTAVAVLAVAGFSLRLRVPELALMGLGIYFVPTFLHLSGEVWLRAV